MATLTVADDRLLEVDEYAKNEERSREDIVNEAISLYLRKKRWNKIFEEGDRLAVKNGITEDVVAEEISSYREKKKSADK
jgi:metal-responsive CopG/Arc/MetJ family transcriptional regulator